MCHCGPVGTSIEVYIRTKHVNPKIQAYFYDFWKYTPITP